MPQTKIPDNSLTAQERKALVEENLNLVRFFAHRLCKNPELYDDCFQEGCFGLMRAARLYDSSRPHTFSDFAAFEIQCSIRDFLFRNRIIRLPDDQRSRINKYQTTVRQLEAQEVSVSAADMDKLAEELGLLKEVQNLITNPVSSLNACNNNDENSSEFGDTIADVKTDSPLEGLMWNELVSFIRSFFSRTLATDVDEKTRKIVLMQLDAFIAKSLGNEFKSFKDIVASEFPELDVKGIEFDRQYTRISGVWREYLNMAKNRLKWNQFV